MGGFSIDIHNKRFNAEIASQNFSGDHKESTIAPFSTEEIAFNQTLMSRMLDGVSINRFTLGLNNATKDQFPAFVGKISPDRIVEFLEGYRWAESKKPMSLVVDFLRNRLGDPEIESWLFLAPQLVSSHVSWPCHGVSYSIVERGRVEEKGRFNVYTGSDHVRVARYLAGNNEQSAPLDKETSLCRKPKQGIFLFYPVVEKDSEDYSNVTMGFALVFPKNRIVTPISFRVRDLSQPNAIVVD